MDFALSETQQAIAKLTAGVLDRWEPTAGSPRPPRAAGAAASPESPRTPPRAAGAAASPGRARSAGPAAPQTPRGGPANPRIPPRSGGLADSRTPPPGGPAGHAPGMSRPAGAEGGLGVEGLRAGLGEDGLRAGTRPGVEGLRAGTGLGEDGLWKELARAGLLALALPEALGGDGLSVAEVGVLLTELGRRAMPGPALATLMLGVLPVARLGRPDQQAALLDGVGTGDTLLTAAIREPSDPMPAVPATIAVPVTPAPATPAPVTHVPATPAPVTPVPAPAAPAPGTPARTGDTVAVTGVKAGVPYAAEARWILVPAALATGGTAVLAIDPHAAGVTLWRTPASAGSPEYTVRLDAAPASHVLGGPDPGAVTLLYQLALAGACCLGDGALAGALALTTAHAGTRRQFGRPLATFQAAAQQLADTYITARTLHLATQSACWRLGTGRDAAADLAVAGYWLAGQAPAALRTCHHLHGGLGMDVSYPLHRYSALIKDLIRLTGGADYRLDALADTVYP